jgi:hypothetical protein
MRERKEPTDANATARNTRFVIPPAILKNVRAMSVEVSAALIVFALLTRDRAIIVRVLVVETQLHQLGLALLFAPS